MQAVKYSMTVHVCLVLMILFQLLLANTSSASYPVEIKFYNNSSTVAQFLVNHQFMCKHHAVTKFMYCFIDANSTDILIASNLWVYAVFGYRCLRIRLNNVKNIPNGAKTVMIGGRLHLALTIWISGTEADTWLDYKGGPAATDGIYTTFFKPC